MKCVIINADDFGLTKGINRGIIQAYREGILTSASLIANMPAYEDAIDLAKKNPELGIGVHLNLLRGKSILPKDKIPTLVNKENRFYRNSVRFLMGLISGIIRLSDIEREFEAQIDKVIRSGIQPTHIDSEKHLHSLPRVIDIVAKLASRKKIKCIRWINEPLNFNRKFSLNSFFNKQIYKSFFLNLLSKRCSNLIKKNNLLTTDKFIGIVKTGYMDESVYKEIFLKLGEGNWEIMTHPGYIDNELEQLSKEIGSYFINKYREAELKALLCPELKQLAKKMDIRLINFNDLKGVR